MATTDYSWKKRRSNEAKQRAYVPTYADAYEAGFTMGRDDAEFVRDAGKVDTNWQHQGAIRVAGFRKRNAESFRLHPNSEDAATKGFDDGYQKGVKVDGGW